MAFLKIDPEDDIERVAEKKRAGSPACAVIDEAKDLYPQDHNLIIAAYVNYKAALLIAYRLQQLDETLERNLGQLSGLNINTLADDIEGGE